MIQAKRIVGVRIDSLSAALVNIAVPGAAAEGLVDPLGVEELPWTALVGVANRKREDDETSMLGNGAAFVGWLEPPTASAPEGMAGSEGSSAGGAG